MRRRHAFRPQVVALEDRCVPAVFTVNSNADVVDPNDGVLTLREAIQQANATPGHSTIMFDMAALPVEPFPPQVLIRLAGTELVIRGDLTILGPGADDLRISGENLSRVFDIAAGASVELSGLRIDKGGLTTADGAGIHNAGTLTVRDTVFVGNATQDGNGGAIYNLGTLLVTDSLFDSNSAFSGGAITNFSNVTIARTTFRTNFVSGLGGAIAGNGVLSVNDSLFTDNRAGIGGALYLVGNNDATLVNTTVSGNRATGSTTGSLPGGGGIFSGNRLTIIHGAVVGNHLGAGLGAGIDGGRLTGASLLLHNTIVAANTQDTGTATDLGGQALLESSHNLIGFGGGLTDGVNGNQVGISDPQLTALVDHGGPTLVHAPLPGSPALDAGDTALAPATDQRGLPRLFGAAVDIGPYEKQTLSLIVDVAADVTDNDFSAGNLSLREAVELSNKNPGEDAIAFAESMNGATVVLDSGELTLDDDVIVTGPGADQLTISGNDAGRVFLVSAGVQAELSGLTIAQGWTDANGGGVRNAGNLLLRDSAVISSEAPQGGGLANDIGAVLILDSVRIAGNTATLTGGGAYNLGTLTVSGGVIENNSALHGGGITNVNVLTVTGVAVTGNAANPEFGAGGAVSNSGGTLTITASTLSDNSAAEGGAIINFATLGVNHSTLSGNHANGRGGAIWSDNTLTLLHSTVTANRADADGDGSGLAGGLFVAFNPNVVTLLHHTIVAGNFRGSGSTPDDGSGFLAADSSFNVIGTSFGLTHGVNGNQVGTITPIDPRLGPLQDNGGPTLTHLPLPDSPAVEAGDPNLNPVPKNDQRGPGFSRVIGGSIDVGAVEAPLAYAITLDAGALSVLATGIDDTLTIRQSGADLVFSDPATIFFSDVGAVAADMHSVAVPLASISAGLTIDLGNGDDSLIFDWNVGGAASIAGGVSINGGNGFDSVIVHGDDATAGVIATGPEAFSGSLSLADVVYAFSNIDAQEVSRLTALTFATTGGDDAISITSTTPGNSTLRGTSGGLAFADLTWSLIPAVVINTAAGDSAGTTDTVTVAAGALVADGMKFFTVVGGEGRDSLRIDPASFKLPVPGGAIRFHGGPGVDTILSSGNSNFTLTNNRLAATPGGNVALAGVERAVLVGGPGKNTLDAKKFKGAALLDGGAGNDTLIGAKGRNVLIGGRGRDTLTGGPGEDLLIGGAVTHEAVDAAFAALFDEWTRGDLNYNRRRANLLRSGLLSAAAAPNDRAADLLAGGPGRDWFWAFNKDKLVDRAATERRR